MASRRPLPANLPYGTANFAPAPRKYTVYSPNTWKCELHEPKLSVIGGSYLEGHGDSVSRFITPVTHVEAPIMRIISLLP